MKKIILSLMLLFSNCFSTYYDHTAQGYYRYYVTVGGTSEHEGRTAICGDSNNQGKFVCQSTNPNGSQNCTFFNNIWTEWNGSYIVYKCTTSQIILFYKLTSAPDGWDINSNGDFVPPPPICGEGSHLNTASNTCVGDFPLKASTPLESGGNFSLFEDGATMYCRPNGECETTNDKGERIPNRFVNGAIPSEISDLKDFGSYLLSKVGNAVGKTLQWGGMTMLLNGTGGGALIYEGGNPALNGLNPVFVASAGLIALGNALVTEENVVLYTPKVDGVLNVDIVEKTPQTSTANLDAQTPSDGSPALSENGAYTQQQITAENAQTIWEKSAGVGKLPPNALVLGSDIIYPSKNPDKAIVNTPDALLMVETKPDGSSTIIEVSKNDIATSSSNNTDLNYIKKDISPTKINNDGTTTTTTNTSVGSVSTATNTNTNTSPTGTTTTTDPLSGTSPNGVITPSSDGTGSNINLSGVTSRLDKISNQLTVQNKRNEELDNVGGVAYLHGVPTGTNPYDWTSYQGTFDNLKNTIDGLNGQFEEMKSLFQNGFTLNLSGTPVDTCPYSSTIDLVGNNIAVSFDLCKTFSPMRPLFYGFFYIYFVFITITFGIKSILRFV